MLIIAMSNMHAQAILEFVLERFPDWKTARIGQDIPEKIRLKTLDEYRKGEIDVMVQVDMIGEGTDIKPISVIVKADLVRAFSKTMQQIFRGMRYFDGFTHEQNICDLFASNDSDSITHFAAHMVKSIFLRISPFLELFGEIKFAQILTRDSSVV